MRWLIVSIFFILVTCAYLWPASYETFHSGKVIGQGNDETTLPYYYSWIPSSRGNSINNLLNGYMYNPTIGAPAGSVLWIPYIERFVALAAAPFASPEKVPLIFLIILHLLSGLFMTLVGRRMKLGWLLSISMGICFSFTPFNYWRGRMHLGLAGVYFLPLFLLAYDYLDKARSWRNLILPAILLFLSLTTAHYLILILLTLLPIPIFLLLKRSAWAKRIMLIAAFIPFLFLLIWTRIGTPLNISDIRQTKPLFTTPLPESRAKAWDVLVYSARPIDYLTGNYDQASWDINPLRSMLTKHIRDTDPNFYPQERSSGIRWFLIVGFILTLFFWKSIPDDHKRWLKLGLIVAVISYLFSLSPRSFAPLGRSAGLSHWLHLLVHDMRAPNRWSIGVNGGLIVVTFAFFGFLIDRLRSKNKFKVILHYFPFMILALSILEFPPTFAMPTTIPASPINRTSPCGLGAFLPYHSNDDIRTYRQILHLRGSDCRMLNAQQEPKVSTFFEETLGEKVLVNKPLSSPAWINAGKLLSCMGVEWVVIDPKLTESNMDICRRIGFETHVGDYCQSHSRTKKTVISWTECLPDAINNGK